MTRLLVRLIVLYQKATSPLLPRCCRFEPSCSEYLKGALERRGLFRGSLLGLKRLLKCAAWHPGGYDPVK